ncbi:hypothetical protein Pcinc_028535 [Petrolisthes cinctipes]|uniref:Fibrinogen C-terminal domain-containing protein n=1 Tax=Petrolisthes cinctipes TaxID=88211 RepID=A0AAE1F2Y7_PETCI|nr:hypothetical protein Pcinc_028535 [Petrolisthes cinctipes]KAK3865886.1 hypothetical protein Pcinc_028535 [Petrolisthes cinctipes]
MLSTRSALPSTVMITKCQCVLVVLAVLSVVIVNTTNTTSDTYPQLVPFPLQNIATSLGQLTSVLQDIRNEMRNNDETMKDIHNVIRASRPPIQRHSGRILEAGDITRPRHCQDLLKDGDRGRGVRQVYPFPGRPHDVADVYCDHNTDGGGWLVFQRRLNLPTREDFNRTWIEYQLGFGNMSGEFWAGLDIVHVLTSSSLQQLRIDMGNWEDEYRWVKYGVFKLGPSQDNYRLTIGRYTGDTGDNLEYHNGQQFSTYDADHDTNSGGNCAMVRGSGWWFKNCETCNLNGLPHEGEYLSEHDEGIHWDTWMGDTYSMKTVTMMIKPALVK